MKICTLINYTPNKQLIVLYKKETSYLYVFDVLAYLKCEIMLKTVIKQSAHK